MRHFQVYLLGVAAPYAFIYAKELWAALSAVGIKKDVQPWIGIDRRQFARQLDGNERFDFNTMGKFPVTVMQEFLWRVITRDEVGLPERVRKSLPLLLALAVEDRPQILQMMNVAETEEEKAS